jgi:type I restriction enzyme S subunit
MIVVRSGVNTGDCALVPLELDGALAAFDLVVKIEPSSGVFYCWLLNSRYGKKILAPLTRRAAQAHLNAEQVKNLCVISPSVDLRTVFADRIRQIDVLRRVSDTALDKLDALFASLQHRAFRGEL